MKQIATKLGFAAVTALLLAAATTAQADSVQFRGSDDPSNPNSLHKADATFTIASGKLTIDLFNRGVNAISGGVTTQDYILTGLFFDTGAGVLHLSNSSSDARKSTITLGQNSGYVFGGTTTTTPPPSRGDVSQNWAYGNTVAPYNGQSSTVFTPTSSSYGVAATAYALSNGSNPEFQDANRFNATNPGFLDGVDYGLITGSNAGQTTFIKNGVEITFAIDSGLTSVAQISKVYFKYDSRPGTATSGQPGTIIAGTADVPEPAYIQLSTLIVLGGAGSLFRARNAKRKR